MTTNSRHKLTQPQGVWLLYSVHHCLAEDPSHTAARTRCRYPTQPKSSSPPNKTIYSNTHVLILETIYVQLQGDCSIQHSIPIPKQNKNNAHINTRAHTVAFKLKRLQLSLFNFSQPKERKKHRTSPFTRKHRLPLPCKTTESTAKKKKRIRNATQKLSKNTFLRMISEQSRYSSYLTIKTLRFALAYCIFNRFIMNKNSNQVAAIFTPVRRVTVLPALSLKLRSQHTDAKWHCRSYVD